MGEELWQWALRHMPDAMVYMGIVLVTLLAAWRCFGPVNRNVRALRRATRAVLAEAKLQVTRPAWNDLHFLGNSLENDWAAFLQNAELMDAHGEPCDVEDYINADTVIYHVAHTALADLTPGVLVSLGILGTFLGITQGLAGLQLDDAGTISASIQTLVSGMSLAFLTSICGIIASMIFNFSNRFVIGRAQKALARFVEVFQRYAMPKPPDTDVQMLAMQQEQNSYLRTFVEEISVRSAAQMEQAILRALLPVQRSMDNFIVAATREQVEGMDHIAARFVERLNLVLDGQFQQLGATLSRINESHSHAQADMQTATAAISGLTGEMLQVQQQSQTLFAQMGDYLRQVGEARAAAEATGAQSAELLESMHAAAMQQAKYLGKLQEYQAALQGNMQQYTTWTERFLTQAEQQTEATSKTLDAAAASMQDSAALLQSSYATFGEELQAGLSRALSLLDKNMTGIAQDLNASLGGIHAVVQEVPGLMSNSARKYGTQVDQFVEALAQLQKSMQGFTKALEQQKGAS